MKLFKERCLDDVLFNNNEPHFNPGLQRLYAYFLSSPIKDKMIKIFNNSHDNVFFVVSTAVIHDFENDIRAHFDGDKEVLDMLDIILHGKKFSCDNCGSITLNANTLTYRDNGGCVSRRFECPTCICIKGTPFYMLSENARTKGSVAAKQNYYTKERKSSW